MINLSNKIFSKLNHCDLRSYNLCILFWTLLVIQEAVLVRNGVGDGKGMSHQQKIWNMNNELFFLVWIIFCEVNSLLFQWQTWGEGDGGKRSRGSKKCFLSFYRFQCLKVVIRKFISFFTVALKLMWLTVYFGLCFVTPVTKFSID